MQDFLGNELDVGDKLVVCATHGRNSGATLVKATVIGFTNQFVRVVGGSYKSNRENEYKISPEKVIKISCAGTTGGD